MSQWKASDKFLVMFARHRISDSYKEYKNNHMLPYAKKKTNLNVLSTKSAWKFCFTEDSKTVVKS